MSEEAEEYAKRLSPASDEEIIGLARLIWANEELRVVFERIGCEGDLTESEEAQLAAVLSDYRQGDLWDRDELHLALASCLVRKIARGSIERFDCEEVRLYLRNRKVKRVGTAIKVVSPTVKEIIGLAQAMRKNEEVWEIYVGTNNKDTLNEHELEVIESFKSKYRRKHGLYNRSMERMNLVSLLLRELALGNLDNLESPKAVDLIKSNPLFKKLGESNG